MSDELLPPNRNEEWLKRLGDQDALKEEALESCPHDRLNEDGSCRGCGVRIEA